MRTPTFGDLLLLSPDRKVMSSQGSRMSPQCHHVHKLHISAWRWALVRVAWVPLVCIVKDRETNRNPQRLTWELPWSVQHNVCRGTIWSILTSAIDSPQKYQSRNILVHQTKALEEQRKIILEENSTFTHPRIALITLRAPCSTINERMREGCIPILWHPAVVAL